MSRLKTIQAQSMMKLAGFVAQHHQNRLLRLLARAVSYLNTRRYGANALDFLNDESSIDHLDYSDEVSSMGEARQDDFPKPGQHGFVKRFFIAAGLMNFIGVLLATGFFSHNLVQSYDPQVMSTFGLLIILVWGCAYFATASVWQESQWLVGVFVLVKSMYFINWLIWMLHSHTSLSEIFEKGFFPGLFYSLYGINDLLFAIFFAYVFNKLNDKKVDE